MGNYKGPMCLRQTGRQRDREREIKKDVVPPWLGNVVTWNKTDRQTKKLTGRKRANRARRWRKREYRNTDRQVIPIDPPPSHFSEKRNKDRGKHIQTDRHTCLSICLSVCPFVCMSACQSGWPSVCLSTDKLDRQIDLYYRQSEMSKSKIEQTDKKRR